MELLTSNKKLAKCDAYGYLALGVQMYPGRTFSGLELCPSRGACFKTCLASAGMGAIPAVAHARRARSELWATDPSGFKLQLMGELHKAQSKAAKMGLKFAVRLNTFSDVEWEVEAPEIFEAFSEVQFYDYTKIQDRARLQRTKRVAQPLGRKRLPANYHLTFSWSERALPQFAGTHLRYGGNIAFVCRDRGRAPRWVRRAHQVDGDEHDLTFLHPPGSVLLLSPKGALVNQETPFA